MTTLDASHIALYASQAGFSGNDLVTAVAVALAESGGNTQSHNTNASTGDNSYGPWQINMFGALGPARLKLFGIADASALFDPATNARCAYILFKQTGWKAWSTYNSGAYKSHLTQATQGVANIPPFSASADSTSTVGQIAGAIANNLNPVSDLKSVGAAIGGSISGFSQTIYQSLANVAGVIVALVLLVTGVVLLNKQAAGHIAKAGAKVASVAAL